MDEFIESHVHEFAIKPISPLDGQMRNSMQYWVSTDLFTKFRLVRSLEVTSDNIKAGVRVGYWRD
jgi:hypothetical protein